MLHPAGKLIRSGLVKGEKLSLMPDCSLENGVPDPYYGGPEGFDEVIELLRASCLALIESLGSAAK